MYFNVSNNTQVLRTLHRQFIRKNTFQLVVQLRAFQTSIDGHVLTLGDFCRRDDSGDCIVLSLAGLWQNNLTLFDAT